MANSDREQLDRIEDRLSRIEVLLTGNGSPERGVIVRLDRLEQDAQRHVWWSRTAIAACITTCIAAVAKILFGH